MLKEAAGAVDEYSNFYLRQSYYTLITSNIGFESMEVFRESCA
jgi:hypothetical protein